MEHRLSSRASDANSERPLRRRPIVKVDKTSAPAEAAQATARKVEHGYHQPSRKSTRMIAGHFDPEVSFALQELLASVGRKRRKRVTVQDALTEALRLLFEKHGVPPPAMLAD